MSPTAVQPDACEGFDRYSGQRWIYPNNMSIRGYQKHAVEMALFTNAMIVLPTGFGKTFIAAVVMYNFYRWYPEGKIIFVAPTRPLVAQQIEECKKISGIPSSDCIELTGTIPSSKRLIHWQTKRVFFATPQVMENDLENRILPAKQVKCLVIDEAHRAQGSYAYVGIVRQLHDRNRNGFRILALSATPGSDIQRVQQVMLNLYIGDVMFRSENSIDLMQFKNEKISKAWTVPLTGKHKEFVDKMIKIADPTFKKLYRAGLTYSGDSIDKVSKYVLVMAMQKANSNELASRGETKGGLKYLVCAATSLSHHFELLTIYGIRVFYSSIVRTLEDSKGRSLRTLLASSFEFDVMMDDIRKMFGDDVEPDIDKVATSNVLSGHPKLQVVKDLLFNHFQKNAGKTETRAMVFSKYRESVYDIVQALKAYDPILKPAAFVGQNTTANKKLGLKQKEQIQMVKDFKEGKYNVLVATCVAEEGLDIGEVDIIICYDTSSSPISNTQRRGRTGRKRAGDVQTLLTQGYEERKLKKASASKRQVEDQLFKRENYISHKYRDAPKMIPPDIKPVCLEQKIFPVNDQEEEEEAKPKRKRRRKVDEVIVELDCEKKEKNPEKGAKEKEIELEDEPIKTAQNEITIVDTEEEWDDDDIEILALTKSQEFTAATTLDNSIASSSNSQSISNSQVNSNKSMDEKDAKLPDSDIDWGSDIEYDCV